MPDIRRLWITRRYYDLDDYLFNRVTHRFARRHTLKAVEFYAIISWKSNRTITTIKAGLDAAETSPRQLMSEIYHAHNDRERMRRLDDIRGIGVPIASAVLTVCYPHRFTILDKNAWKALFYFNRVPEEAMPDDSDSYFDTYLPTCRQLARELRMSLRELDRALWGWSKLKSLIDENDD